MLEVTCKSLSNQQHRIISLHVSAIVAQMSVDASGAQHYPARPCYRPSATRERTCARSTNRHCSGRSVYGASDRDQIVEGIFPIVSVYRIRPVPTRHPKAPADQRPRGGTATSTKGTKR